MGLLGCWVWFFFSLRSFFMDMDLVMVFVFELVGLVVVFEGFLFVLLLLLLFFTGWLVLVVCFFFVIGVVVNGLGLLFGVVVVWVTGVLVDLFFCFFIFVCCFTVFNSVW